MTHPAEQLPVAHVPTVAALRAAVARMPGPSSDRVDGHPPDRCTAQFGFLPRVVKQMFGLEETVQGDED